MSDNDPPDTDENSTEYSPKNRESSVSDVSPDSVEQFWSGDHSGMTPANDGDSPTSEEDAGLFDGILEGVDIFDRKDVLRPSYTPTQLPHRTNQIDEIATNLASALRGDSPSNMLIYGKPGTGKTASAKYVSQELLQTAENYEAPCTVQHINCEITDTRYRVLAQLANEFIQRNEDQVEESLNTLRRLRDHSSMEDLSQHGFDSREKLKDRIQELDTYEKSVETVPMTGWPTDRVYSQFFKAVDLYRRIVVIMLDEIDKLVEKSGDDTLYNLSRMNTDLERSKVSIIGISNDLTFTDLLDPRVKSSLGEDEIVFPPYNAAQLRDILRQRANVAFHDGVLGDEVIPLCAAFAAREHGDARKALDLLRTAGELAERSGSKNVADEHVRNAQQKIELDRIVEAVRTLPTQSKLVLLSIIRLDEGTKEINTGKVYNEYEHLCKHLDVEILTQRRVTDLIDELDVLGIINAVIVSKGRYGRSREINLSIPLEKIKSVVLSDSRLRKIKGD